MTANDARVACGKRFCRLDPIAIGFLFLFDQAKRKKKGLTENYLILEHLRKIKEKKKRIMSFTVYKSSAGSGKTFTLVKEYLKLVLTDDQVPLQKYRRILAITFTNKAAAEMKDRVIHSLEELASTDNTKRSSGSIMLLQILMEETGLSEESIRSRAEKVLEAILHNYSEFAIGTIDSFVHKVVRSFAFDLKIPMNFDIETDAQQLLSQAIDLLINKIGSDEKITKVMVEFLESRMDDEKSRNIENELLKFSDNLLKEEGINHLKNLRALSIDDFFEIRNVIYAEIGKFEKTIKQIGSEALALIASKSIHHSTFAGGEKAGIAKYFCYLSTARMDKLMPSATIVKNMEADKWYASKADASEIASIDSIKDKLALLYEEGLKCVQQNLSEINLFQLIGKNLYSLTVLHEIENLLNEYKSNNNILHISEFNKLISDIVLNQPVPFLYERLGEKYNNYLIDEFQDTSLLQFQNLLPLIDNALAEDHFTMLVGDGKQAIYRWRGGEVEQFSRLPEIYKHNDNPNTLERGESLKRSHNPRHLKKNFRSKAELVEFNNAFFRTLSGKLHADYQNTYDNMEQEFNPENKGGYVSVEFIDAEREIFREMTLQKTHEIILQLQAEKYQLKDIAILVRKNTDGSDIAQHLSSKGIGVVSSESLLLSNSVEVNFIHTVFNYLKDEQDAIAKTAILEYLIASKKIKHTKLHDLIRKLISSPRLKDFDDFLQDKGFVLKRSVLVKMSLYELCEEVVRIFKLNEKADPFVQFFLDEVFNYASKNGNNLNEFLEWWEKAKEKSSIVTPDGINAVSIMTIHRSKGLEFPAVILPFANGKTTMGKDFLWIDLNNKKIPQLQSAIVPTDSKLENTAYAADYIEEKNKSLLDHLNVLYVAMTRPQERLYVLTAKPTKGENINSITDMFSYYFLSTGELQQGKNSYEYGIRMLHNSQGKETQADHFYTLHSFHSQNWREKIKMRTSLSETGNAEDDKKEKGIITHTALSRMNTYLDIEPALNSMLTEGLIDDEQKTSLQHSLQQLLQQPEIKKFFEPQLNVKTEAEILLKDGSVYRPDRIITDGETIIVIDFKTGKASENHKQQLQQYGNVLNKMGFQQVEKYLIYVDEERVERVERVRE